METGLYLPGDGLLHRWHPLTKLALTVAAFMLGFANLLVVRGVPLLASLLGLGVAGLVALDGAETLRLWTRRLVFILAPIFLSLVLVQGFFFPGAEQVLWRLGPFGLKLEGLLFAAQIAGRLFLLTGATLLLLLSTQPTDLALALNRVGLPREISYLVIAAIQLLPRMQARATAILDAQRARGLRTEGSPMVRLRALLPLAGPLIG
ncbi:MAG TPA: energy-coupling factor transporter transmembrane protein EcfT, partial [Chloroflexi bacterium]|nr:energy-coupling factor transporter transmembrane protein EcfT [Chloroflexota bacterium]